MIHLYHKNVEMPKRVDHKQKRNLIIEALIEVAARDGLASATFRKVAGHCGISVRQIQYYFRSRENLMMSALDYLEKLSHQAWRLSLESMENSISLRAYLETLIDRALPLDQDRLEFHLLWLSFAVQSVTDPALAQTAFREGPERLERQVEDAFRAARRRGEIDSTCCPNTEASNFLHLLHGHGTSILVGKESGDQAKARISAYLDRLF